MRSKMMLCGVAPMLAAFLLLAAGPQAQHPASTNCMQGPDYVPGMDVDGQPVPQADASSEKVPVPAQIAIPLRQADQGPAALAGRKPGTVTQNQESAQDPAYVTLDGAQVDRLVHPPPCRG
jgi:hypothetical protein